jgi:HD-like signal output (HDOD) protein
MSANEQTKFLQELAESLNSKDIELPSFPDVVINIRTALEDPTCSAERLAEVVRTDPILVTRVLISANSAFHNRAGIEIVDLGLAISRLGFETVRNTAITLAVDQIFRAGEHDDLKDRLKELWNNSISLSSMCYSLAQKTGTVNSDNAFLCGLLHEIGKLYILTKARDYPELLGNEESLNSVIAQWCPSVGRSIVQAWGFPEEIAETMDGDGAADDQTSAGASLVDVVIGARMLVDDAEWTLAADPLHPSIARLNVDADNFPQLAKSYEMYVQSMRQSIGG